MEIGWNHPAVRLTGRWSRTYEEQFDPHYYAQIPSNCTQTTTPGSYFEIAFTGSMILLKFDLGYMVQPFPHIWIQLDHGTCVETAVDRFLRVQGNGNGPHLLTVVYKGGMEMLPRWHMPLMGSIAFIGAEAQDFIALPADERPLIEFIGDSITEGVMADADYSSVPAFEVDQFNRPYQDDSRATYAFLTAEMINARPMFMAYSASGLTKEGCGNAPRAGLAFPYVFDHTPYIGEIPDMVVINHGANDRDASAEEYLLRYGELLDLIRKRDSKTIIVCLSAFCGAFDEQLAAFVKTYNQKNGTDVYFISSNGWIPGEPLHPLRDGHKAIAARLAPILMELLKNKIHK